MKSQRKKSFDIDTIKVALKALVRYHDKKYNDLPPKYQKLHDLVIKYHNDIVKTEFYDEFYILVQEIFSEVKVTKKNTIGEFYRACTLASENSNDIECFEKCKNSLRPPLTWSKFKCSCTIIKYTDDTNYHIYEGKENNDVLIHVDTPTKTKFSKSEINNFINKGYKKITVMRNINGNHVDVGTYELDGKAIYFEKCEEESPAMALFFFAVLLIIFLFLLYLTKPRPR